MDENQIAAEVAQNIPKEQTVDSATETVTKTQDGDAFKTHIDLTSPDTGVRLAEFLGVGRMAVYSEETQRDMKEVYRWASEKMESNDIGDVLGIIGSLEMELGIKWEKNRLQKMAHWVRLHNQAESLRKQMGYLSGSI